MEKLIKWKTRALVYGITLLFVSAIVFMACKKNRFEGEAPTAAGVFDASAAKEWFYGVFKKTKEFTEVPVQLDGRKLPDWKTGRYKKAGSMEVVEFDLVMEKKKALIKQNENRADASRLAEATINKAVFVKKDNKITLNIVQYLPEAGYAQANGYDISKNSIIEPDKTFSGKVLITRWNTLFVKGYNISNGKKTRIISQLVNRFKQEGETPAPNSPINPDCYYSYYAWFEQNCTVTPLGDGMSIEVCSDWELIWDNVVETSCPITQSECEEMGLDTEACLCQTLGLCGNNGEPEDCSNAQAQVEAIAATHQVDNELIEHTSTPLPNNEWEEHYKWQIYKVSWPCTKRIYSNEKAILKYNGTTVPTLPANTRIFSTFTHGNLSSGGFTFGYGLSYEESNNYVRKEPLDTYVKVWFDVTTELGCGGSPIAYTTGEIASKNFYP
jgi:hypothetical protein